MRFLHRSCLDPLLNGDDLLEVAERILEREGRKWSEAFDTLPIVTLLRIVTWEPTIDMDIHCPERPRLENRAS